MRFIHRIGLSATSSQLRELEALGVAARRPVGTALPGDSLTFVAFDVDEAHPNWSRLRLVFEEWKVSDFLTTQFTKHEVESAKWLEFVPDWYHGYPQPEQDFGFLETTYDLADWCAECGMGLKQKAPFQMKGEPKWGRRGILQLNWVFNEFFVTPEVWSGIFEPRGVVCRPVMSVKGLPLKSVLQIVVAEEVDIATDGLVPERCAKCGRVKYRPVTRGFFPALTTLPKSAIARTKQAFGSGAAAHERVLISQDLARALAAGGVRGASLKPVAEPDPG
jgi:hypothetical protein